MQGTNGEHYQPSSMLVHNLINRLTVIVGRCDLMMVEVGDEEPEYSERLEVLRELAKSMARELVEDQGRSHRGRDAALRV
jgi:hypothetical protein